MMQASAGDYWQVPRIWKRAPRQPVPCRAGSTFYGGWNTPKGAWDRRLPRTA